MLSNVSKDTAGQFTKHILILNRELTLYSEGFDFSPKIVRMDDPNEPEEASNDCCSILLITFSIIFIVLTFPISIFFCIRIVPEYERAIIFRLGRLKKVKSQIIVKSLRSSHCFADTREALLVPACSSSSPVLTKSK